jgi:hypothetical protein
VSLEVTRMPSKRSRREQRTLKVMIDMYCAGNHSGAGTHSPTSRKAVLCEQCGSLLAYAEERIERCRFGDDKPTCARCTVHCFRSNMREVMRKVMRYSGPRMTFQHPYLSIRHLLDRRRTPEERVELTGGSRSEDKRAD